MVNSIFQNVQGLKPRRRAYNLSKRNDFTCHLGTLIPVYTRDLIPNTSFYMRVHGLIRFLPMVAPIMDNIDLYLHVWQAPRRIIEGEQFTDMITGETPDDEINLPYFTPDGVISNMPLQPTDTTTAAIVGRLVYDGSLFDMLGYDKNLFGEYDSENHEWTGASIGKLNARKFILYARLLCQWYINENVEPWNGFVEELEAWCNPKNTVQGDISEEIADFIYHLYQAFGVPFFCHGWPKDYFTSGLPSLQYGEPVYLPMGQTAPVHFDLGTTNFTIDNPQFVVDTADSFPELAGASTATPGRFDMIAGQTQDSVQSLQGDVLTRRDTSKPFLEGGIADLTEATAITINELRLSNALQVFKEREMKFGRRAPEHYKGYYGVKPRDMRLQIPEYIGGGRMPINVSDVEQTSQTTTGENASPLGQLAGKGTGIAGGFAKAKCFVPEESLVMAVAFLMPKVTYANLLSRHDTKLNDRFDYYNPSFVHIGEQEIYNYELYAGNYGNSEGNQEFAYQPRYTEYRFDSNELHGDFKGSLSYWTLGRIFTDQPHLNASFVYMNPLTLNRIFAVVKYTDNFPARNVLVSLKFDVVAVQPLSRYGTPSLIV